MSLAFSAHDHNLGHLFEDYQTNPGNAELHHLLCLGLNFRGLHQQCIEVARPGLLKHGFHPNIFLELLIAKNLTDSEDILTIGEELENLVHHQPGELGHIRNLALYHFYLEDDTKAEKLLNEILDHFELAQIDPYTFEVFAQLHLALGRFEKCLKFCDYGLAKQGCSARLLRIKGLCLLEQGSFQASQACFEQALDQEPFFLWACNDLGNLHLEKGELPAAFAYFGKAISINPKDSASYFLQAEAYAEKGLYPIASAEMEKLILTQPSRETMGEAYSALGVLNLEHGNFQNAQKTLLEAIRFTPTSPAPYHTMGLLAQQMAAVGDPLDWFNQALEADPEHVESWLSKGTYFLSQNSFEEAEACYQTAVDLDPESADAYLALGEMASKRNLPKNQLMYLRTASQLEPENPRIQVLLAQAYLANHASAEALSIFEKGLASASRGEFLEPLITALKGKAFSLSPAQKSSLMKALTLVQDDPVAKPQHQSVLSAILQKLGS